VRKLCPTIPVRVSTRPTGCYREQRPRRDGSSRLCVATAWPHRARRPAARPWADRVGRSPQFVAADLPPTWLCRHSYSFFTSQGSVSLSTAGPTRTVRPEGRCHIPVGPTDGHSGRPEHRQVYVSNYGSNFVSVIDGHTNRVTGTIGVGAHPADIGVVPSSDTIYVADRGNGKSRGTVSVIDGHTDRVSGRRVGYEPFSIGVNTLSDNVYVGNQAERAIDWLPRYRIDIHGTNVIGTVGSMGRDSHPGWTT